MRLVPSATLCKPAYHAHPVIRRDPAPARRPQKYHLTGLVHLFSYPLRSSRKLFNEATAALIAHPFSKLGVPSKDSASVSLPWPWDRVRSGASSCGTVLCSHTLVGCPEGSRRASMSVSGHGRLVAVPKKVSHRSGTFCEELSIRFFFIQRCCLPP